MKRIMIIRHAEKPNEDGPVRGVTLEGTHDRHELSVVGWQRAGALGRYFAPLSGVPHDPLITVPNAIYASAATPASPSFRAQNTVSVLAAMLNIMVRIQHPEGDEIGLARAVLVGPSPALIAWHHKSIPALVDALTNGAVSHPHHWPEPRFDVVWVLDRHDHGGSWTFSQTGQRVMPGDRAEGI